MKYTRLEKLLIEGDGMSVELFGMNNLSLERAETIVPEEYLPAFRWFQENEGIVGPRPWQSDRPDDVPIKMVAQSGIMKPAGYEYAISVTSTGYRHYDDQPVYDQGDRTWIFSYSEHRNTHGGVEQNRYNGALLACLNDGIPVGVFIKESGSNYTCLGLAFVEEYDAVNGIFTMHGPVNASQTKDFWSLIPESQFDEESYRLAKDLDLVTDQDERIYKTIQQVNRRRQDTFRANLLDAYRGACAVTAYSVDTALQAAHISSYRGPSSQLTSNGLLLRADIHLLYDAHRISVCPDDMSVRLSEEIRRTPYGELNRRIIRLPSDSADMPSQNRLATHFAVFREVNGV